MKVPTFGTKILNQLPRPIILALSGGVARSASQAGFLAGLLDSGFSPDGIVGLSGGAINAAYVAWKPGSLAIEGLLEIWRRPEVAKIFAWQPWRPHRIVVSNRGHVEALLNPYVNLTFSDMKLPLSIGAADLSSRRVRYFREGPVVPALRASGAIPLVFKAVRIDGRRYYDAGFFDNFGGAEAVRLAHQLSGTIGQGSVLMLDASVGRTKGRQRATAIRAVTDAKLSFLRIDVGSGGPKWSFAASAQGVESGLRHADDWLRGIRADPHRWGN